MTDLPHRCEKCGGEGPVYMSPRCHPGFPVFCVLAGGMAGRSTTACGPGMIWRSWPQLSAAHWIRPRTLCAVTNEATMQRSLPVKSPSNVRNC